jgi:hypothetical protein
MGETKKIIMNNYDEHIDEQIQLKLYNEHLYYVNLYDSDNDDELNEATYENKN